MVSCSLWCMGQSVVLPDTLFAASQPDVADGVGPLPDAQPQFTLDYVDNLFRMVPTAKWDEYAEMPWTDRSEFTDLPEYCSQFFVHVLLLHLSKIKIAGLDEQLALHNLMLNNFNRNLYDNLQGPSVIYSGCLDPVEAYRRWVQKRRLQRAEGIIKFLEDEEPVLSPKRVPSQSFKLPDNLLQENNYDVKVKADGNNPPYRP